METWMRELRYATRRVRATPAFSATITLVFMVAVGIGISISSVATATREQAVPYAESENLIWLFETNSGQEIDEMQVSLKDHTCDIFIPLPAALHAPCTRPTFLCQSVANLAFPAACRPLR